MKLCRDSRQEHFTVVGFSYASLVSNFQFTISLSFVDASSKSLWSEHNFSAHDILSTGHYYQRGREKNVDILITAVKTFL